MGAMLVACIAQHCAGSERVHSAGSRLPKVCDSRVCQSEAGRRPVGDSKQSLRVELRIESFPEDDEQ